MPLKLFRILYDSSNHKDNHMSPQQNEGEANRTLGTRHITALHRNSYHKQARFSHILHTYYYFLPVHQDDNMQSNNNLNWSCWWGMEDDWHASLWTTVCFNGPQTHYVPTSRVELEPVRYFKFSVQIGSNNKLLKASLCVLPSSSLRDIMCCVEREISPSLPNDFDSVNFCE